LRILAVTIGRTHVRDSDCCEAVTGLFEAGVNQARSRNVTQATQRDSMVISRCGNAATLSKQHAVDSFGSRDQSTNATTAKSAQSHAAVGARVARRPRSGGVPRARCTCLRTLDCHAAANDHERDSFAAVAAFAVVFAFAL